MDARLAKIRPGRNARRSVRGRKAAFGRKLKDKEDRGKIFLLEGGILQMIYYPQLIMRRIDDGY